MFSKNYYSFNGVERAHSEFVLYNSQNLEMFIFSFQLCCVLENGSLYAFMTTNNVGHTRNSLMQNDHYVISHYMFWRKIWALIWSHIQSLILYQRHSHEIWVDNQLASSPLRCCWLNIDIVLFWCVYLHMWLIATLVCTFFLPLANMSWF